MNQVEIYFSTVERKVLMPNDLRSLTEIEDRLLRFLEYYEVSAQPFDWKFTRRDLRNLLAKVHARERATAVAA